MHHNFVRVVSFVVALILFPASAFAMIIIRPPVLTISPESGYADDMVSPGVHPNIGTGSASVFTFKVVYAQSQNNPPMDLNIVVGDGTTTTSYAMTRDFGAGDPTLHDGNYINGEQYIYSGTFTPSTWRYHVESDWGTQLPATGDWMFSANADPGCTVNCYDNVLFLPGIEASRLYDISGNEIWLPDNDTEADYLSMTTSGVSIHQDVTTGEAIDEAHLGQAYTNIYKSFLADMKTWENTYHITATTTPYDWRLDYDTVVSTGRKLSNGHISYLVPPETGHDPYIIETLKQLASTSATGKVTIIAHSQGGLIAKAIMQKLGATTTAQLVDKVILVASPQLGTPLAIPTLLNGTGAKIPNAVSAEKVRQLAQNMQSAYNLLPSANYFTYTDDPVITIASSSLPTWASNYGDTIHSVAGMDDFMADGAQVRTKPAFDDLVNPEVVPESFLNHARDVHTALDNWIPPAGVELITVAGWGMETLSGIEYRNVSTCISSWKEGCLAYSNELTLTPNHVIDGDGTVVEPSAQWANGATSTKWWVNLPEYNKGFTVDRDHKNILEVPQLRTLIQNTITGITTPLQYISTVAPQYTNNEPRLHFTLHSPLTLEFYDTLGNHVGYSTSTGNIDLNIPGVRYEQYGDVQWLSVPRDIAGQLVMHGTGSGSFTLDAEEASGDNILSKTSFEGIPSGTSTIVTMNISPTQSTTGSTTLLVDEDGDNTPDITLQAKENSVVTLLPSDLTSPEAQIFFSTSTNLITVTGTDDQSVPTVSSTTTYPTPKKKGKDHEHESTAITTTTITDQAGNTTILTFTEAIGSSARQNTVLLQSIRYNGVVTDLSGTTLSYKWNMNKKGGYTTFATHLKTASTTVESHYRPKKNVTILMTKPADLDDRDDDGDDVDVRPIKQKLSGMVIPGLQTNRGIISVNY